MTSELLIAAIGQDGRLTRGSATAIIPWWSFTKTLIAASALKLSEQGRLSLDDEMKGFAFTPRQLLRHSGGVGNYGSLPAYHAAVAVNEQPWIDDVLLAHVSPTDLLYPPGRGWAYSNVGYLLVRRFLERTYGDDLAVILKDLIFQPLGIGSARLAQSPSDVAVTALPPPHPYNPGWTFHGFVVGPVSEAAVALHRLLESDFLSPLSRAALLDRQFHGNGMPGQSWETVGYGTGVMMPTIVREGCSIQLAGHSAAGPGSAGAVFHALDTIPIRTVAAFGAIPNAAIAEQGVAECMATG